jgi:hypothetical protein
MKDVSDEIHVPAALSPRERGPPHRTHWIRDWSGRCEEEKNVLLQPGIKPQYLLLTRSEILLLPRPENEPRYRMLHTPRRYTIWNDDIRARKPTTKRIHAGAARSLRNFLPIGRLDFNLICILCHFSLLSPSTHPHMLRISQPFTISISLTPSELRVLANTDRAF